MFSSSGGAVLSLLRTVPSDRTLFLTFDILALISLGILIHHIFKYRVFVLHFLSVLCPDKENGPPPCNNFWLKHIPLFLLLLILSLCLFSFSKWRGI